MQPTFIITHGSSSRAARPLNEAEKILRDIHGKEVYVTVGVRSDAVEESIKRIRVHREIINIEERTIEVGPYLVQYKLIYTR